MRPDTKKSSTQSDDDKQDLISLEPSEVDTDLESRLDEYSDNASTRYGHEVEKDLLLDAETTSDTSSDTASVISDDEGSTYVQFMLLDNLSEAEEIEESQRSLTPRTGSVASFDSQQGSQGLRLNRANLTRLNPEVTNLSNGSSTRGSSIPSKLKLLKRAWEDNPINTSNSFSGRNSTKTSIPEELESQGSLSRTGSVVSSDSLQDTQSLSDIMLDPIQLTDQEGDNFNGGLTSRSPIYLDPVSENSSRNSGRSGSIVNEYKKFESQGNLTPTGSVSSGSLQDTQSLSYITAKLSEPKNHNGSLTNRTLESEIKSDVVSETSSIPNSSRTSIAEELESQGSLIRRGSVVPSVNREVTQRQSGTQSSNGSSTTRNSIYSDVLPNIDKSSNRSSSGKSISQKFIQEEARQDTTQKPNSRSSASSISEESLSSKESDVSSPSVDSKKISIYPNSSLGKSINTTPSLSAKRISVTQGSKTNSVRSEGSLVPTINFNSTGITERINEWFSGIENSVGDNPSLEDKASPDSVRSVEIGLTPALSSSSAGPVARKIVEEDGRKRLMNIPLYTQQVKDSISQSNQTEQSENISTKQLFNSMYNKTGRINKIKERNDLFKNLGSKYLNILKELKKNQGLNTNFQKQIETTLVSMERELIMKFLKVKSHGKSLTLEELKHELLERYKGQPNIFRIIQNKLNYIASFIKDITDIINKTYENYIDFENALNMMLQLNDTKTKSYASVQNKPILESNGFTVELAKGKLQVTDIPIPGNLISSPSTDLMQTTTTQGTGIGIMATTKIKINKKRPFSEKILAQVMEMSVKSKKAIMLIDLLNNLNEDGARLNFLKNQIKPAADVGGLKVYVQDSKNQALNLGKPKRIDEVIKELEEKRQLDRSVLSSSPSSHRSFNPH